MAEVPLPAVVVANSSLGGTTAVPPVDGPRQASRTDHSSASSDSTSIPLQDVSGAVPPPATRTSTPDRMDPIPPSEPEMAAGSIGTVPTLDTGTQDSNATGDRVRPETGESGRRFRIPTWLNPLDQLPGLVIGILGTVYMLSSNRYAKWTTEKDFWEYCSETKKDIGRVPQACEDVLNKTLHRPPSVRRSFFSIEINKESERLPLTDLPSQKQHPVSGVVVAGFLVLSVLIGALLLWRKSRRRIWTTPRDHEAWAGLNSISTTKETILASSEESFSVPLLDVQSTLSTSGTKSTSQVLHNTQALSSGSVVQFSGARQRGRKHIVTPGSATFRDAILRRDVAAVQQYLSQGLDVNGKDRKGSTPLHWAALSGSHMVLRLLLDAQANTEEANNDGQTVLGQAAEDGGLSTVALLLEYGANPQTGSEKHVTPLHWAIRNGHSDVARLLIARLLSDGCTVNLYTEDGDTPLMEAAKNGDDIMVDLLLKHGATINAPSDGYDTALNCASRNGHINVIDRLLDAEADMEATARWDKTALVEAAASGREAVVLHLLGKGANTEAKDLGNWTALHHAAANGHVEMARVLVAHGANLEAQNYLGRTPLMRAAENGCCGAAMLLLDAGAGRHAVGEYGRTLLHYASAGGDKRLVRLLLEYDVDPDNAASSSQKSISLKIAEEVPLDKPHASRKARADIEMTDEYGHTALHIAADCPQVDVVKVLMAAHANVNAKNLYWDTPLHRAASRGHINNLIALLEGGANLYAKNDRGETAVQLMEERCRRKTAISTEEAQTILETLVSTYEKHQSLASVESSVSGEAPTRMKEEMEQLSNNRQQFGPTHPRVDVVRL